MENARKENIAEKVAQRGGEVDQRTAINIHELKQHANERFSLKRFLIPKKGKGDLASANNMLLLNRERQTVTSEEFGRTVVDRWKAELLARIVDLASQKLPGADKKALYIAASSLDLRLDLNKTAA